MYLKLEWKRMWNGWRILHILLGTRWVCKRYERLANVKRNMKSNPEPIITPNKWQSQHHECRISNGANRR